ncbi:MAG TPA: alkaline phosphatase family protein [Anaerolineales bacterium]|nr:alkaline phosphatase family protein [Anaerolineales bacterium]
MANDIKTPPLVILGFDVGDPDSIETWAREGYLPTMASIMRRGGWGRISGPELVCEHGIWVSMFSGVSRSEHGYYYFRQLKPGTYDLQPTNALDASVLPFWSCLRASGKKAAIVDVPDTRPVAGLLGAQLADWATHYPLLSPAAEPASLLPEAHRVFGPQLKIDEKLNATFDDDRRIYRRLMERLERKGSLCRHLLARDRFDLVAIVFSECHTASHQFWKYRPEAKVADAAADNALLHATRDIYESIDRQMGLLLAQLPREANVFILSSVGMEDDYPTTGLIEAFCRQLGYQAPPESQGISPRPIDLVRRVVPEAWRIALSRHLPREKREGLLADQFRNSTNWHKTTAFAIPTSYTSFVRVNLRGREPDGIVEPGAEYEALLNRIEADLKQLVDPLTNEPAVSRVARTVEMFHCSPHVSLPDLFVEWKPGHFMQRVVHPEAELKQENPDFYRPSDHSSNGFVAVAGPSIKARGALGDISLLDLVPTFLALLDEPIPPELTGKPLQAVLGR